MHSEFAGPAPQFEAKRPRRNLYGMRFRLRHLDAVLGKDAPKAIFFLNGWKLHLARILQ
jgi:hypothetical protein